MASLLRKKPNVVETFDPVSASTWAAGAKATAATVSVVDLLAISHSHKKLAKDLTGQLEAATALTPCAVKSGARTSPKRSWSFDDYILAVKVCQALRVIILESADRVPHGAFSLLDITRETAANEIRTFAEEVETYAKLVKRERSYERISGNKSARRR